MYAPCTLIAGVLVHQDQVEVFAARVELVGAADSATAVSSSDYAVGLLSVELGAPVQHRAARVAAAGERPWSFELVGYSYLSGCPCRAGVDRAVGVRDPESE